MNHAIAFDLDGVLLDAKELHRRLFMEALAASECVIDDEFHERELEALSTKQKVAKLVDMGLLDGNRAEDVKNLKQKLTMEKIGQAPLTTVWIPELLEWLKSKGFKIALCSNSVRQTCVVALMEHRIIQHFDIIVSNEDVSHQKPAVEPYVIAAGRLGTIPNKLIVFEDSAVGIRSASNAGCIVVPVFDPKSDLAIERVKRWIEYVTG